MSAVERRSRAPDAAQHQERVYARLQRAMVMRGRAGAHASATGVACWVPALRSNAKGVAARPGHERASQIPRQLGLELPVHRVLDLAAIDPDVGQGAVVELVQRLDGGAALQAVEQGIS